MLLKDSRSYRLAPDFRLLGFYFSRIKHFHCERVPAEDPLLLTFTTQTRSRKPSPCSTLLGGAFQRFKTGGPPTIPLLSWRPSHSTMEALENSITCRSRFRDTKTT
jgi:hypothetical protein